MLRTLVVLASAALLSVWPVDAADAQPSTQAPNLTTTPASSTASSLAPAECAAKYHAELTKLSVARGDGLGSIFKQMRTAEPALPGRWLFGLPPGGNGKKIAATRARVERVCVEQQRVKGRMRCERYEQRILPSTEIGYLAAPSTDEAKLIKSLTDFVEGRGAIAEVGNNGRYQWLVQRMAQDLKGYITQAAHPALCSGGREVGEFYDAQLAPMQKRLQDVAAQEKRARDFAVTRVREAVALHAVGVAQVAAKAKALAAGSLDASTGELSRDEMVRISREAADAVAATLSADDLLTAVARTLVPAAVITDLQTETSSLSKLRRLKSSVLEVQDRAADGTLEAGKSMASLDAGKRALRMVEALINAEMLSRSYQPFVALVLKTPQSILSAHKAACTCED